MNAKLKKLLGFLFILLSVAAAYLIAFSNNDLSDVWSAVGRMNLWWLAGIFGCWCVYTLFDAVNYWCYLNRQGFRISLWRSLYISLIGFYYSNITPGAAGGQPMQVHALRKAGIPVGYGTMAITIRFITNQTMITLISVILFLFNRDYVYHQLGGAVWFVRVGWIINFSAVPLILLSAYRRTMIQKLAEKLIMLGSRIHIIRNSEASVFRVTEILDTYHSAFHDLMHSPSQIIMQFAWSALSLFGLYFTVVFVYYAFGQSGTPWYHLLTLSSLLYISASVMPLPGASGAQEGGFLLYYRGVFSEGIIGLSLLVWRFFTFHLYLLVGLITLLFDKIFARIKKTGNSHSKEAEKDCEE